MIVDVEHHYHFNAPAGSGGGAGGSRSWKDGRLRVRPSGAGADIDKHLEFMDRVGIDVALLTGSAANQPLDDFKSWNDKCARAVSDHPARFAGFASTQPLGGDPALVELERAVRELGMKGVHIGARPGGQFLDSRELWPFYEKCTELGAIIDVHIDTDASGFDTLSAPWGLHYVVAREFDMIAAVFRLCFGGVLEAFPDLKFIMNHFGGGVSAIIGRMDLYVGLCGDDFFAGEPLITRPWNDYFDKLYFNMAGRGRSIATVKSALSNISPDKLMFGSDWPYNYEETPEDCAGYIEDISKLDISARDIQAMLGGNAAELLGLEDPG